MCCGCCFLSTALVAPRFGIALLWLFTDYVSRAFDTWVLPFLGLLFLPFTTLAYVIVYNPGGKLDAFEMAIVIFAFLIDIFSYFSGAVKGKQTYYGY